MLEAKSKNMRREVRLAILSLETIHPESNGGHKIRVDVKNRAEIPKSVRYIPKL